MAYVGAARHPPETGRVAQRRRLLRSASGVPRQGGGGGVHSAAPAPDPRLRLRRAGPPPGAGGVRAGRWRMRCRADLRLSGRRGIDSGFKKKKLKSARNLLGQNSKLRSISGLYKLKRSGQNLNFLDFMFEFIDRL